MKKPNLKNNFTNGESFAKEPFFGIKAAQTAQQVVPLTPETVYTDTAPTVAMRIPKSRFSSSAVLAIIAIAVISAFAAVYTIQNQSTVSAQTDAAIEENKIESAEIAPRISKTEPPPTPAPQENLIVAETKNKQREKRAPQPDRNAPILIYDSSMPVEENDATGEADEPPRPRSGVIKDKKFEKHLRKIERAKEEFKQIKEILEDLDNN